MPGGWNIGSQFAAPTNTGTTAVSSAGTYVTGNATPNVFGSWAQITSSAPADCNFLLLNFENNNHLNVGNTAGCFGWAYNIGVGAAGSERVMVPNLVWCPNEVLGSCTPVLPVNIKAGTRIAAQVSTGAASDVTSVNLTLIDTGYPSELAGGGIDSYGYVSSSSLGTAVSCGATANTKSTYTQLTSSTTADYQGFFFALDNQGSADAGAVDVTFLLDIAVGTAGSEKIILPDYSFSVIWNGGGNNWYGPPFSPALWIPIAAGSRIAARGQSTASGSPYNTFGLTLYGFR